MNDTASQPRRARGDQQTFLRNTLARLATAVVGIPILLISMFWSPWWVFQIVVVLCIARAGHELFRVVEHKKPLLHGWGILASLLVSSTLIFGSAEPRLFPTLIVVLALVGTLLGLSAPEPHDRAGMRIAWLLAGPVYVGGLLASIGQLHRMEHGGEWVLLSMWLAWGSDTGAYFAGRYFGKRKLYPQVSPSKTFEGAVGGLLAALSGGLAAHFGFLPSLPLLDAVLLSLTGGMLGQLGDLVESLIKRSTGVKDSGSILPGHGGILDRVDALMFTGTACLLYCIWFAR